MPNLLAYGGRFFHSIDWFEVLCETTGIEPWYLVSEDGDAVLPCKDIGGRLFSLTNFYSQEWAPLGKFERLLGRLGSRVEFQFLKDDTVEQVFRDHGWYTFRQHQYANWTTTIEGGFASYFKQRPSQVRNTVKRRSKELNGRVELRIYDDASRWAEYVEVYNESWKKPEPYPDFIPRMLEAAAYLGILRLGVAYIAGEPAAAQIWLVESGRATIYKLAYKEKFKSMSVGSVLSHEMFRHAIDVDGVTEIDYGVGDEPYKADWMTKRGEVFQLTAYKPGLVGRLCSIARAALS